MTERDSDLTTIHVRRAQAGEEQSLAWIVARFTPLVRVQANYRMRGRLRRLYDPEDLVNEVWAVTIPRLNDLRSRNKHLGPVILKFLGTTLLNLANNALRRALAGRRREPLPDRSEDTRQPVGMDRYPAEITSVLGRAERDDAKDAIWKTLELLSTDEREVVVLRGIEQVSNTEASRILGAKPSTVAMRYKSALEKLRRLLPDSVFDELP